MTRNSLMRSTMTAAILSGLVGCNMYVVDFEKRLPNGTVLAPKADVATATPATPMTPVASISAPAAPDPLEDPAPLEDSAPLESNLPLEGPVPLEGSENIVFMDSTTAQLQGCRVITNIRLSYRGTFDDGMVMLRNSAVQINANRMIPLQFFESGGPTSTHYFSAKMVRCPIDKKDDDEVENG